MILLPDLTAFQADAAAGPVLAEIRQERWRKARDAAKELCRKDKARYLPLLVAANAGLAQDLLNRGLTQDAAPVLEYLKTIAPPELLAALRARQTASETGVSLRKAIGGKPEDAAAWQTAESAALALDAGEEPAAHALHAADILVTASWALPETGSAFASELRAVRAAVQATGDGLWDAARKSLQMLPRRSLFAPWRFFLRGVKHAHLGEKAEAQGCFDALPAGSSLVRAAALYREVLGLPPAAMPAPAEASLAMLAALAGVPSWAAPLTESQRFWQRSQLGMAYEALANPLRQFFPTDEPGLASILTDVMMASCAAKSPLPRKAQQELLSLFLERSDNEKFRSDRERLFAFRFFLHEDRHNLNVNIAEDYGAELARTWARVRKPDPLRESAIWTMIAGNQMDADPDGTLHEPPKSKWNALQRIHEKAASLDPENPAPGVRLARFHEATNNQSAYNDQLTVLVKRFPEAKAVLLLSAEESVRRKSWLKALKTLRQARTADPADGSVISLMLKVLEEQAVALFRKAQPVPATLWEEVEPLLLNLPSHPAQIPDGFSMERSRWAAYAFQGCLARPGQEEEAVRLAPSAMAHHFLLHLLRQRFSLKHSPPVPAGDFNWQDLLWIGVLLESDDARGKRRWLDSLALGKLISSNIRRLKPSAKMTEDLGGLLAAVHRFDKGAGSLIGDNGLPWTEACNELTIILGPAARKQGSSYQIRIAACILPDRWDPPEVQMKRLQGLMAEAAAAGDISAKDIATKHFDIIRRNPPPSPWDEDEDEDEDEVEDEVEDEDEDEEQEEENWNTPPGSPMEMLSMVRIVAASLKVAPKADMEELQHLLRASGLDLAEWKVLESLAKMMVPTLTKKQAEEILDTFIDTPLPPLPSFPKFPPAAPRPQNPKRPARPDPSQPELF